MSERLVFTNTRMRLSGKTGMLKPDAEGYYVVPVGAFNCMNSAGEIYTSENIDRLFSSSSAFMQKITDGKLFGEWGHPLPRPGESPNAYLARASMIDDKDTCVFFESLWNDDKAGRQLKHYKGIDENSIITYARLKPHGDKWEVLDRALKDPNVNIAFSVRNMGRDRTHRGVTYVAIEEIITYDAVTHQGVASSEKHASLHLESHKTVITPALVDKMRENLKAGRLRMENADAVRKIIAHAEGFFKEQAQVNPAYFDWARG